MNKRYTPGLQNYLIDTGLPKETPDFEKASDTPEGIKHLEKEEIMQL